MNKSAQLRDEAFRAIGVARHWMRVNGHAERFPQIAGLIGRDSPEAWRAAAAWIGQCAQLIRDDPFHRSARALIRADAQEVFENTLPSIKRALELDRQACALMLGD